MKDSWQYRWRIFMLPGLKRWILFILIGIIVIVYGVFLLLGVHPLRAIIDFVQEILLHTAMHLHHTITGIIAITAGVIFISFAVIKITLSVLSAFVPTNERDSIPDVLYRKRHLDRGPRVVVIGGGTGLSNMLKGLKEFTNNITAIVTVGDDGGSSGRLRQELGVIPPGDIRNCITALADEEKLVTELFRYRFQQGSGLEGHSFGNLFLSAVCAITNGDMLEAARAASRVLNSCGQVLPSSLQNLVLVAELTDGSIIKGESYIPSAGGRIKHLTCEPAHPEATPEALEAIANADLIILGPGSLFTSVIPNLLVKGIPEAIAKSAARKVYVCNVITQQGETTDFSVSDHVEMLLHHATISWTDGKAPAGWKVMDRVMINTQEPKVPLNAPGKPVNYDGERLRQLGVRPILRALVNDQTPGHHDPDKLATALMLWYFRHKPKGIIRKTTQPPKVAINL